MARNHARVHVAIWQDDDFLALRPSVQRLYLFLLSQPNLTHLGVLPLTLKRWARTCSPYSLDDLADDLLELSEAGFVVVDDDAEELLVRTLLRNDGIYKQPNVMRAAITSVPSIHSDPIKRVLLAECDRIDLAAMPEDKGKREEAETLLGSLREALDVPDGNPPPNPSRGVPGTPSEGFAIPPTHTRAQPLVLSPTPTPSSGEGRPARPDMPDGFAEFWMVYPRKVAKQDAIKAYRQALKRTTPDKLHEAAKRYAQECQGKEPEFVKHPASWLRAGRYEDEPQTQRRPGTVHPHNEWATLG